MDKRCAMIELPLSDFCLMMIAAAMVIVGLCGWISLFAHRNAEKRGTRQRFQCDLCLTVWQEPHKTKIATCPNCGKSCSTNRK
jgi:hypothetical protein